MTETKTVSLLDLRPRLTDIIRDVSLGHTFVITRYGEPIATLAPAVIGTQMDAPLATSPTTRPLASNEPVRAGIDVTSIASQPKANRQAAVDQILGKVNRKARS